MSTLRLLFADDQLPWPTEAENARTRAEIRRELAGRPGLADLDAAFDEDFRWFQGLLDYLERTKGVRVIRAASFAEACARIDRPQEFDLALIDLSWWGDATLPPGREHRHNRGLELLERLAARRAASGRSIPAIALSQNFREDFELMSTVLDLDALPMPKSYDAVGHRALFSAIRHLARLSPAAAGPVRLFLSHAHRDADLAERLVDAVERAMEVPEGAIRCTSLAGYKLDLGAMAPEALRRELAGAEVVVALLTPQSLASHWVLFELGATWLQAKRVIPLLGGGLREEDIPGPLRGAAGGRLEDAAALVQCLDQLQVMLGWPARNPVAAQGKLAQLAAAAAARPAFEDEAEWERRAGFAAKRTRIGSLQGAILDHVTHNQGARPCIPQRELEERFREARTGLFYRLEQLRLLGFLARQEIGQDGRGPVFGWTLSPRYRAELD